MKAVGILGGGQLGCMLAEALVKYGAEVHIFDPDPHSPAKLRTPYFTSASWQNTAQLSTFFDSLDVATFEFENVEVEQLRGLAATHGFDENFLRPSCQVLQTTQSRASEKLFITGVQLPCAPFAIIETPDQLLDMVRDLKDIPASFVAKTLRGGYDGKGQAVITNGYALQESLDLLKSMLPIVIEEKIALFAEASVIVARDKLGNCVAYPPFENEHRNHILFLTHFPSISLPSRVCQELVSMATECANKLNIVGLLTVEFFISMQKPIKSLPLGNLQLCNGFYIGINEFAPRPHNSGHITRSATPFSQFDLHARTLLDLPLPNPQQLIPRPDEKYVMSNLLGDLWSDPAKPLSFAKTLQQFTPTANSAHENVSIQEIYLYGKKLGRPQRKMGHVNLLFPKNHTLQNVRAKVTNLLEALRLENTPNL